MTTKQDLQKVKSLFNVQLYVEIDRWYYQVVGDEKGTGEIEKWHIDELKKRIKELSNEVFNYAIKKYNK